MVMFRRFVLSSLREESLGGEADKWRQKRNLSFDQNRQLEEVTKERDGLKKVAVTLQRVVSQLVAYCACAEDELNRTVLTKLLARLQPPDESALHLEEDSRPSTPCLELSTSLVSRSKHVHFAPDLQSILVDLDEDGLAGFLAEQRDLSADIKRELEHSLLRLRNEAHDLLDLSAKLSANKRPDTKMLESGHPLHITELVEQIDQQRINCDNCELHRKQNMEEAMSECLQRENLLRSDLEAAMMKIAQLMTTNDRMQSSDLIAEGYGTVPPLLLPLSLPARASPRPRPRPLPESGAQSLDGGCSPRANLLRMQQEIDNVQRERDDLAQQLEAANRQLRSTRQFVEEQAAEREAERDEFAKRLAELRDENGRLATRLQNNARILNEMHCLRLSHCNCRAHDAHVEQLEAQTREMNQIIVELETRKASTDDELKSQQEKISLLRDIINTLESQLEQKTTHETEILEQLQQMRNTIDERDRKMRALVGELESMRSERDGQSDVMCVKCGQEEDRYEALLERVREQTRWLEEKIHRSTQRLERIHEVASTSCSEPSEDVSLRDQKNRDIQMKSPEVPPSPRVDQIDLSELAGIWECLEAHSRAEAAALKRIADLEMQRSQLKDVAQEVRAERDVLQARMSEQALKISSLSARLQQQRNDAEALASQASSQLSVRLHDTLAEQQRNDAEALASQASSQLSVQLHDTLAEVNTTTEPSSPSRFRRSRCHRSRRGCSSRGMTLSVQLHDTLAEVNTTTEPSSPSRFRRSRCHRSRRGCSSRGMTLSVQLHDTLAEVNTTTEPSSPSRFRRSRCHRSRRGCSSRGMTLSVQLHDTLAEVNTTTEPSSPSRCRRSRCHRSRRGCSSRGMTLSVQLHDTLAEVNTTTEPSSPSRFRRSRCHRSRRGCSSRGMTLSVQLHDTLAEVNTTTEPSSPSRFRRSRCHRSRRGCSSRGMTLSVQLHDTLAEVNTTTEPSSPSRFRRSRCHRSRRGCSSRGMTLSVQLHDTLAEVNTTTEPSSPSRFRRSRCHRSRRGCSSRGMTLSVQLHDTLAEVNTTTEPSSPSRFRRSRCHRSRRGCSSRGMTLSVQLHDTLAEVNTTTEPSSPSRFRRSRCHRSRRGCSSRGMTLSVQLHDTLAEVNTTTEPSSPSRFRRSRCHRSRRGCSSRGMTLSVQLHDTLAEVNTTTEPSSPSRFRRSRCHRSRRGCSSRGMTLSVQLHDTLAEVNTTTEPSSPSRFRRSRCHRSRRGCSSRGMTAVSATARYARRGKHHY
ncbi:hypothetical protein O0L34_g16 [Tuta absoluta]|nr:hypothetical protein O0L34_g16 [Tuta absoluta]